MQNPNRTLLTDNENKFSKLVSEKKGIDSLEDDEIEVHDWDDPNPTFESCFGWDYHSELKKTYDNKKLEMFGDNEWDQIRHLEDKEWSNLNMDEPNKNRSGIS